MKIITVCRSGFDYEKGLDAFLNRAAFYSWPDVEIICLRDSDLMHDWPGWWSKIEIFRIPGPALYLDVSCQVVDFLHPMLQLVEENEFIVTRDFNPYHRLVQSCVMGWSGDMRYLYDAFVRDPEKAMKEYTTPRWWGDQGFIEYHARDFKYWQGLLPGAVVSYKKTKDKSKARVVVYHGRPKPWELSND